LGGPADPISCIPARSASLIIFWRLIPAVLQLEGSTCVILCLQPSWRWEWAGLWVSATLPPRPRTVRQFRRAPKTPAASPTLPALVAAAGTATVGAVAFHEAAYFPLMLRRIAKRDAPAAGVVTVEFEPHTIAGRNFAPAVRSPISTRADCRAPAKINFQYLWSGARAAHGPEKERRKQRRRRRKHTIRNCDQPSAGPELKAMPQRRSPGSIFC
jgi:hypothetical protein